jgi:hypothetical protein
MRLRHPSAFAAATLSAMQSICRDGLASSPPVDSGAVTLRANFAPESSERSRLGLNDPARSPQRPAALDSRPT